jgi:hypothetical protein
MRGSEMADHLRTHAVQQKKTLLKRTEAICTNA